MYYVQKMCREPFIYLSIAPLDTLELCRQLSRFENMWLNHSEVLPMVEYWWKNTPLRGRPGHGFINKLKRLKEVLKKWNKEVFGCISTKRNQLLTQIALLDQMEETNSIPLVQHTQKKLMKAELISKELSLHHYEFELQCFVVRMGEHQWHLHFHPFGMNSNFCLHH